MSQSDTGWRELFERSGFAVTIFAGGIALQALEVFIGGAMLPTVVRDIGGLELFAWNTTLFIVASIIASIFAAVRPASIGPRGAYLIAAGAFGLGSLICGVAPSMPVLLAGRFVQGFGAGLLSATTYAMIRIVFPQHLWARAMALNSVVWGISTLLGPAAGGIFAELDLWRWAFLGIVPLAILLALGAYRILPAGGHTESSSGAPVLQIGLVIGAILAISTASLLTSDTLIAGALLLVAVAAIVALAAVEGRARVRLMPAGSLNPATPLGALFATMLLLGIAITSDIFAPFFLQKLHGLQPLWAGYVAAFVAAGWTISALVTAGWTGRKVRVAIATAPIILTAATLGMLVYLAPANLDGGWLDLVPAALSLLALGVGIGSVFQHLSTGILSTTPEADNQSVSAALSMAQLFASGFGAAIGGVVVNAAGLPEATDAVGIETVARWLFGVFAVIAALGFPLALRVARRPAQTVFSQPPSTKYVEPVE